MTPIIRRFVMKLLSKDQGSGITKLPGQMQSGFQESIITEKLVRNGYDPRVIKDESELKIILNRIDATAKQSKEQKDKAMKQLATIMDMKGRKIKPGARIMGGEEVIETEAEIATRMGKENKQAAQNLRNKKMMTEEEIRDFADEFGIDPSEEYYNFDGTLGDAKRILKESKDYEDAMFREYKAGRLDPKPGEKGRKEFLQKKMEEMELSGDNRLMTKEEIEELSDFEDFATGGRAGFMAGGMGRRAFLKMMAAGGAGIAGLKSGLINIFKPRSQAVQEVVETVAKSDATGMPEHFMPLVNKIMNEGKLVKESDRIQTYKHPTRKDIDLEYELDSGSVGVRFDTDQGMPADYYLKKGVPDEMNPRGTGDEFIEGEMKYRMGDGDTYYKNFEEGIDSGTSNLDEFVGIKKNVKQDFASGGLAHMLGE